MKQMQTIFSKTGTNFETLNNSENWEKNEIPNNFQNANNFETLNFVENETIIWNIQTLHFWKIWTNKYIELCLNFTFFKRKKIRKRQENGFMNLLEGIQTGKNWPGAI